MTTKADLATFKTALALMDNALDSLQELGATTREIERLQGYRKEVERLQREIARRESV